MLVISARVMFTSTKMVACRYTFYNGEIHHTICCHKAGTMLCDADMK